MATTGGDDEGDEDEGDEDGDSVLPRDFDWDLVNPTVVKGFGFGSRCGGYGFFGGAMVILERNYGGKGTEERQLAFMDWNRGRSESDSQKIFPRFDIDYAIEVTSFLMLDWIRLGVRKEVVLFHRMWFRDSGYILGISGILLRFFWISTRSHLLGDGYDRSNERRFGWSDEHSRNGYKKGKGNTKQDITFSRKNYNSKSLLYFKFKPVMTQSQLISKDAVTTTGEGNRKRLRITVAHFDNTELIKSYSKTLVGRCMNPEKQKVDSLLVMLPKIWKMEDRIVGVDMGLGKFQFHFDREEDIETVLELQPFHFDFWMIALGRWKQRMPVSYPSEIPFWIKVLGVPSEFWSTELFQSIGDAIGVTTDIDLDFGRIRVIKDGMSELCFDTTIDFKGGDYYEELVADVTLQFEKLFGYCHTCLSLCHHQDQCPLRKDKKREVRAEERNGSRDDRARSYSGVVINGDGGYREPAKEHRGYQGKGKGKMYEEWTRVEERSNKRSYSNRSRTSVEEGEVRNLDHRGGAIRSDRERGRSSGTREGDRGLKRPPRKHQ